MWCAGVSQIWIWFLHVEWAMCHSVHVCLKTLWKFHQILTVRVHPGLFALLNTHVPDQLSRETTWHKGGIVHWGEDSDLTWLSLWGNTWESWVIVELWPFVRCSSCRACSCKHIISLLAVHNNDTSVLWQLLYTCETWKEAWFSEVLRGSVLSTQWFVRTSEGNRNKGC